MRFWLKIFGAVLTVAALALAALPYWLGAVLPVIGGRLHLSAGAYERDGYGRFVLRNAVYQHGAVRVVAAQVRADTPVLWAWRHLRGKDHLIEARGWSVRVAPVAGNVPLTAPPAPPRALGLAPLHDQLARLATKLQRWLPNARISHGAVRWPSGGFTLAQAAWQRREFAFAGLGWAAGSAQGRAVFSPAGGIRVQASEPDRDWTTDLTWERSRVTGHATSWGQPIELSAEYGPAGWLPREGKALAANVNVSAARAGLGSAYGAILGRAEATWNQGVFAISAHASADPLAPRAPPLRLLAEIKGDRRQWSVQALDLRLPYGWARLDRPVSFGYGARQVLTPASLEISADLGAIPLLQARGTVAGNVQLTGAVGALPTATVRLTAKAAAWRSLPPGDYTIAGTCDLQRRQVSQVTINAQWPGAGLRPWLPAQAKAGQVVAHATFDGPWTALRHQGTVQIEGLALPPTRVDHATLTWRGRQFQIEAFTARFAAGATTLTAAGMADLTAVRLTELHFAPDGREALHLASPVAIRWQPRWTVGPILLQGDAAEAGGSFSAAGLVVRLREIPARWLRSVVDWPGPDFEIATADLSAHEAAGRLIFAAQAAARLNLDMGPVEVAFRAESDGQKISLHELRASTAESLLGQAAGELPFAWDLAGQRWDAHEHAPLRLHARIEPNSPFWARLAALAGIAISAPEATLSLDGSLDRPVGTLHLALRHVAALPQRLGWKVPTLDRLDVAAHADRAAITLDHLTASMLGQSLAASGRLPMGNVHWQDLLQHRSAIPWTEGEGHLAVADADVAALGGFLPSIVAPRGRWSANVNLAKGALSGRLHLDGLALRPIAPLGLIQNISGEIVAANRTLTTRGLSAELGGAALTLDGQAQLPRGGRPRFSLRLRGESVPLVRQADLLVRSDLDLRAESRGAGTRVEGQLSVRDGLLLGDLTQLLPSSMAGGARPPPYFSITAAPYSRWRLLVAVTAEHSLRAQTPLFTGTGSAQFQLSGTLGEPRAVGQIRIDQGQISLPFATFDVQFASVRLTADDPFHPQIDVQATSRRYDYDLRLQATGAADAPVFAFTSNPALPSDQILALVMAGQSPRSGNLVAANGAQAADLGAYVGQNLFSGLSGRPSSNRLTVTSGQELSISGRPTYEVEYRLGPRWRLVGEYDIFDGYNAGVKWRVYSKGDKP